MDIKILCLGVLTLGEASGYDIRKHIETKFGHFMDVASNSVYPVLKELKRRGLVTFRLLKQSKYPDKHLYQISLEGERLFKETLTRLTPRHRVRSEFMFLLFFADLLPEERIKKVLQERLQELRYWLLFCIEWKESPEGRRALPGRHFLTDYAVAIMESEKSFLMESGYLESEAKPAMVVR